MILEAKGRTDQNIYSASIVITSKRVVARYDSGGNDTVALLDQLWGPMVFQLHFEAAIWCGPMRATNIFRPPVLVVGVDDRAKKITLDDFKSYVQNILDCADIFDLANDGDFSMLLGSGFSSMRSSRTHLPSLRRLPLLLFIASGHDQPFSFDASPDEAKFK